MTVGAACARGRAGVEEVDGAAEDDLLGVADPGFADQRGQGEQQGQPPGADFRAQLLGVRAGHGRQGRAEWAGVEGVDAVQAAADPDDLPAEVADQRGVVRFGVAQDQHPGAAGDGAGDQPFHQRGLAGAGLAEDEHARGW